MLFVLFLALTVFLSGTTMAQDVPPTFCGDLAAADCTILTDSAAAMRELNSAAFNFQFDFGMSNIPEADIDSLNLRLAGKGAYAIEPGTLDALMALSSPTEMMQNLEALPAMMEEAVKAIAADVTLVLYPPQNLPDMDQPLPERVGLSLRMVDGVGYVNLDKLAELDTSGELPRGWIGLDLAGLLREAMAQQGDMMDSMPDMSNMMNMDMFSAFTTPEFMGSFMTITRGADTSIDGQTAAVFNQAIDLGALYSNPELAVMMREQMQTMIQSMGGSSTDINPAEMEQMMGVFAVLFDGFVIDMTQTIGLDDQYVHQMSVTLDWALDLSRMGALMGESNVPDMQPMNLNIAFQAGLSQFNNAPTISAPENAQMVPLRSLMGGGRF